jgi:WD40 repeat protein
VGKGQFAKGFNPITHLEVGGFEPLAEITKQGICCTFSANGKMCAVGYPYVVALFDLVESKQSWKFRKILNHNEWVRTVVFSPDGKLLAVVSNDRRVTIWNTSTAKWITEHVFDLDPRMVCTLLFFFFSFFGPY